MSTQSPPIPLPSVASTPSSTSTSSVTNTSTLLFGFLVSALSIFAIFMTVAIIWNRLVARRRAIDAMLAITPSISPERLHRPTMWDVWAAPDKRPPVWADIKPVAVQKCNFSVRTTPVRTISIWRDRLLNYVPPEIAYLVRRPVRQASTASSHADISQVELLDGSDVQISLLICMPRVPQQEQDQGFHEMVFATANAVYHDPRP